MKTRYNVFVSAMIGLAALVSCQKELSAPESDGNAFGPGEKMVFKAYASPESKSHFNEGDEGTENQGTLYWDSTDEVGILSLYLHNRGQELSSIFDPYWEGIAAEYTNGTFIDRAIDKYIIAGLTSASPEEPATKATLFSDKPKEDWFWEPDGAEAGEGDVPLYDFFGIYPMTSVPELKIVAKESDGEVVLGVPVEVQSYQYAREGFGKYHVCVDSGINTSEEDYGLYDRQEVLNETKTITFDEFSPLTALLQFDIKSDRDYPIELQRIDIRTDDSDVWLTGSAYVISMGPAKYIYPDKWRGYHNDYVSLDMNDIQGYSTLEVTSSYTSQKFSVAVLPSYKKGIPVGDDYWPAPDYCSKYGGGTLIVEGYDNNGEKIFEYSRPMPTNGFEPGKRYSFHLDFTYLGDENLSAPGIYSVSSDKKVSIGRGNLTADHLRNDWGSAWDEIRYRFFRYPWSTNSTSDYEMSMENIYLPYSSQLSHYGWAATGAGPADDTHKRYNPYHYLNSEISGQEETNLYGYGPSIETLAAGQSWYGTSCEAYCEWGKNPVLVGYLGEGWRTPSIEEWGYLLHERPVSTVNGVASARFAKAKLYGVYGLIIFSDTFGTDCTLNQSIFTASNINNREGDFNAITMSWDDWDKYSAFGLAFLPAAGIRVGNHVVVNCQSSWAQEMFHDFPTAVGSYWSSTAGADGQSACFMYFQDDATEAGADDGDCQMVRYYGLSVRLIKDIENNPDPNLGTGAGNAGSYIPGTL